MVKIKNLHRLKQKEIRLLLKEIEETLQLSISLSNTKVERGKIQDIEFIFLENTPCFFRKDTTLFFTILGLLRFKPTFRFVKVDMGAIQFVTNGADIMAPGIVDADNNIETDDSVWICDETHKKPLAVGIALRSGKDMLQVKKGKAVKIIHHIGDELWEIMKVFV